MFIVLTTASRLSSAKKLARSILENNMGFCVNIIKIEKSVYRWKGEVVEKKEYQLFIKTMEKFEIVEKFIKQNHSYEIPEIILIKIIKANNEYWKWAT